MRKEVDIIDVEIGINYFRARIMTMISFLGMWDREPDTDFKMQEVYKYTHKLVIYKACINRIKFSNMELIKKEKKDLLR